MQGSLTPDRVERPGILVCVLLLLVPFFAFGEEASSVLKSGPSSGVESGKKDSAPGVGKSSFEGGLPPASVKYLQDKNGDLVPVLNQASWEDFLRFLDGRSKSSLAKPQATTITDIEITGSADEERANLKVAYTIRLTQADEFVSVPLFLNEAVLLKPPTYTGDGEESPAEKKDPEQGFVWWFRGRGPHRLELSVSIPLKKQLPSRRIILTLPPSPVSRVQLQLPYPSVTTKALREQTIVEVIPSTDGKTVIEAFGLGTRFDLTWNPVTELRTNTIALESQMTIRALIENDYVQLRAEQLVKSLQGGFDRFEMRLPTGAEQIKLDNTEKVSYQPDPKNPQKVNVILREKSNSTQLIWNLRIPIKSRTVTLDGFLVEGAGKESGRIGLAIGEGLRFSTEPTDSSILRINAGEFPPNLGPVIRAYQFLGQPFKLTMRFDEVKPYFQVRPQFFLKASVQQLELNAVFEYQENRDSLNEVFFTWLDHGTEGWSIELFDELGIVETHDFDEPGSMLIRLVKHPAGRFLLHLRARRPWKSGEETMFSLPRPRFASRHSPTTMTIANAENVETEVTTRGDTVMQQVSSAGIELPETMQGLKVTSFRVDTEEQTFGLRVTPQRQRIRTESLIDAYWQDNQFRINQRLIYEVLYERLSQVRIAIPSSIVPDQIRFFTSRDIELIPEFLENSAPSTTSGGSTRQVLLKLGEGQLGRFEIQAKFSVSFAKDSAFDSDVELTLPMIRSVDTPFTHTRVSLVQPEWFDAVPVSSEIWTTSFSRQDSWQWQAEGSPVELPLKLTPSTHATGRGSVTHALIRIHADRTGQGRVRSQFRMTTRSTSIPIILPGTCSMPRFFWDNQALSARDFQESPIDSRKYLLQIPETSLKESVQEHLLTVEYQDRFCSSLGWSESLLMQGPQLPKCLWDSQVIWQAALPAGHHLLTYPPSATPMFHWQRQGFFWRRKSDPGTMELQRWVAAESVKVPVDSDFLAPEATLNLYTFSQFGAPQPLTFQTLSSPMVLLFGAGFSLVVGFIVLRLVVLRHVMTLLLTALLIAVFGLWYSAPLELLVQPMIAGMIFPAIAVMLESWIRRRHDNAVLSFEGQGEFPPMNAFGSHYASRQADPNEATLHRPLVHDSRSDIPIEPGSGVS